MPNHIYDLNCQLCNPECSFVNLFVPEVSGDKGKVPGIIVVVQTQAYCEEEKFKNQELVF